MNKYNYKKGFKFSKFSNQWWNIQGPFKTLHDINYTRIQFINNICNIDKKKILDYGCGGGILSETLSKFGAKVTGIDIEQELINIAIKHCKDLNIDYICDSIENYISNYTGELFDIVICLETLEHVDDPQNIINNCIQLLKPNGYLFISTINRSIKSYVQIIIFSEYILRLLPRQTHDFKKFIKPSELFNMIKCFNFIIKKINGIQYNPFTRTSKLVDTITTNYIAACKSI